MTAWPSPILLVDEWASTNCLGRFWEDCSTISASGKSDWVHAGNGPICAFRAFHCDRKSTQLPLCTWILYGKGAFCCIHCCYLIGSISRITSVINAAPHHAGIANTFFQQQGITKTKMSATSPVVTQKNTFGTNWGVQSTGCITLGEIPTESLWRLIACIAQDLRAVARVPGRLPDIEPVMHETIYAVDIQK